MVQCANHARHEWSECPFAHPGEIASRRDPASHTGIVCLDMRKVWLSCTYRKCLLEGKQGVKFLQKAGVVNGIVRSTNPCAV